MSPLYPLISKGITLLYSYSLLNSENNTWTYTGECVEPQPTRQEYISEYNLFRQFVDAEIPVPVCQSPSTLIDLTDLVLYRAVMDAVYAANEMPQLFLLVNEIFARHQIPLVDEATPCGIPFEFNWSSTSSAREAINKVAQFSAAIVSWALVSLKCESEIPVPDWPSIIPLPQDLSDHETTCVITSIESTIMYLESASTDSPPRSPDICFPKIENFSNEYLIFGSLENHVLTIPPLSSLPTFPSNWLNPLYPITTCPGNLIGTSFDCSLQDLWACTTVGGCTVDDYGECSYVLPGMYSASGDREPSPCDPIPVDQVFVGYGWTTNECPSRCVNSDEYLSSKCEPIPYGYFGNPCPAEPSTLYPCLITGRPDLVHFSHSGCEGHLVGVYMYPTTRLDPVVMAETWFKISPVSKLVLLFGIVGEFFIAASKNMFVICHTSCYETAVVLTNDWYHIYVEFVDGSVDVQLDGISLSTLKNSDFSDLSLPVEMTSVSGYSHYGPLYLSQVPTTSAYSLFAGSVTWPEVSLFDTRLEFDDQDRSVSSYSITAPDGETRDECLYGSERGQICLSSTLYTPSTTIAPTEATTTLSTTSSADSSGVTSTSATDRTSSEAVTADTTSVEATTVEPVSYPSDTTTQVSTNLPIETTTESTKTSEMPETSSDSSTTQDQTGNMYTDVTISEEVTVTTKDTSPELTTTESTSYLSTLGTTEYATYTETTTSSSTVDQESIDSSIFASSLISTEDSSTSSEQVTDMSEISTLDTTKTSTTVESNSDGISTSSTTESVSTSKRESLTSESTSSNIIATSEFTQTTKSTRGINQETDANVVHSLSSTTAIYRFATTVSIVTTDTPKSMSDSIQDSVNLPVIYTAIALATVVTIACISHLIRIITGRRTALRVHHYD